MYKIFYDMHYCVLFNLTGYRLMGAVTRSAVYNVQTDKIIVLTVFPREVYVCANVLVGMSFADILYTYYNRVYYNIIL